MRGGKLSKPPPIFCVFRISVALLDFVYLRIVMDIPRTTALIAQHFPLSTFFHLNREIIEERDINITS